jgi:hypothetical protein
MTQWLPANLEKLFSPRAPLVFLPPPGVARDKRPLSEYDAIAPFILRAKEWEPPEQSKSTVLSREEKVFFRLAKLIL